MIHNEVKLTKAKKTSEHENRSSPNRQLHFYPLIDTLPHLFLLLAQRTPSHTDDTSRETQKSEKN